jgi:hypothetical protein
MAAQGADKSVPTTRQRLNPARTAWLLAEDPAQGSNLDSEVTLLNRQARPRRVNQRVLRDWRARALNQDTQQRHRSLAYRERFKAAEQDFSVCV